MAKASRKKASGIVALDFRPQETPAPPAAGTAEPICHVPNADVFSTDHELIVEVEMPGVRKEDIEVSITRSALVVKALKYECFDERKINYVCMERAFGKLCRTIELPFTVDTAKVKAVYRNGILAVTIPRVEDKRAKSIRVRIENG